MASSGKATNIAFNIIKPFSSGKLFVGYFEYVTLEVIVAWIFRRIFKMDRSLKSMYAIHGLSLPLMGGAQGFLDPPADYAQGWGTQIASGVKGIPAVLLAHYIVQIFNSGFGLPNGGFKEYIVTALTKVLSRPVASAVYPYLPEMGQDGLAVLHELIVRQARASNLKTS